MSPESIALCQRRALSQCISKKTGDMDSGLALRAPRNDTVAATGQHVCRQRILAWASSGERPAFLVVVAGARSDAVFERSALAATTGFLNHGGAPIVA